MVLPGGVSAAESILHCYGYASRSAHRLRRAWGYIHERKNLKQSSTIAEVGGSCYRPRKVERREKGQERVELFPLRVRHGGRRLPGLGRGVNRFRSA